jgi:hypothetical protein
MYGEAVSDATFRAADVRVDGALLGGRYPVGGIGPLVSLGGDYWVDTPFHLGACQLAVTHSCDTEQRLVDLPINRRTRGFCQLTVRAPKEPNLAPPGWYMLFLTNRDRVPSAATWIHLHT